MKRRTQWFLGAGAGVVLAAVLELFGQWSAALEVLAVVIVLAVLGVRARSPRSDTPIT